MEEKSAPAPAPKKRPSDKAAPQKKVAGKKTEVKKTAPKKASSNKEKAPGRKPVAKKPAPGKAPSSKKTDPGIKPEPTPKSPKALTRPTDTAVVPPGGSDKERTSAVLPDTEMTAASTAKNPLDPKPIIAATGFSVLVILLVLILLSSAANVGNYYVKTVNGRVEICKGRFSPKGVDKIVTLDRAALPADLKEVYSEEEAFPLIFEGILNNADIRLNRAERPDIDLIRRELISARPFAVTEQMSDRLQRRLDKIDMVALVYKADVLAGKGTAADLKNARETLEKALDLHLDEAERGLIEQKIAWIDRKL